MQKFGFPYFAHYDFLNLSYVAIIKTYELQQSAVQFSLV